MCGSIEDFDSSDVSSDPDRLSPSQLLVSAANLIESTGFSKFRTIDGKQYTVKGALLKVATGKPDGYFWYSGYDNEIARINGWFVENKTDGLVYWAARPGASKIRVLGAMRRAARELAEVAA